MMGIPDKKCRNPVGPQTYENKKCKRGAKLKVIEVPGEDMKTHKEKANAAPGKITHLMKFSQINTKTKLDKYNHNHPNIVIRQQNVANVCR